MDVGSACTSTSMHTPPPVPWYLAASSGRNWRVRRRPFKNCARGQRCDADAVSKPGSWLERCLPQSLPPSWGGGTPDRDRTAFGRPPLTMPVPAATLVTPKLSSQGILASVGHAGEWAGRCGCQARRRAAKASGSVPDRDNGRRHSDQSLVRSTDTPDRSPPER